MDHKDNRGTNFAIFFVSLKITDLLYVVNLQFVRRGPISEVETDFFFNWLLLVKSKIAVFVKLICSLPRSS